MTRRRSPETVRRNSMTGLASRTFLTSGSSRLVTSTAKASRESSSSSMRGCLATFLIAWTSTQNSATFAVGLSSEQSGSHASKISPSFSTEGITGRTKLPRHSKAPLSWVSVTSCMRTPPATPPSHDTPKAEASHGRCRCVV
eukprot:scaffold256_cov261-Pinguiococcus_pyrenoidosus.AAC.24